MCRHLTQPGIACSGTPSASGTIRLGARCSESVASTSSSRCSRIPIFAGSGAFEHSGHRGSQGDSNAPAVVDRRARRSCRCRRAHVGATEAGPLSRHMAIHIACMNSWPPLASPPAASASRARTCDATAGLWPATLVQLASCGLRTVQPFIHAAHASLLSAIFLHGILFLSALAFWLSITERRGLALAGHACVDRQRQVCVPAGRTVDLRAAAVVRPHAAHVGQADAAALMADQHLAGLLMIAACPLSYVLTAVILAARAVTASKSGVPSSNPARRSLGDSTMADLCVPPSCGDRSLGARRSGRSDTCPVPGCLVRRLQCGCEPRPLGDR